jgi:pilus assembly protein CpaF
MSLADRLAAARRERVDATELEPVETDALAQQGKAAKHVDPFSHVKQVVHQQLLETLGPKLYDARMTQTDLEA